MVKRVTFVLLIVLSTALAACSRAAEATVLTQQAGAWSATLKVEPYPPVAMKAAVLELAVTDLAGQPVSGAAVTFDLSMPGMEMPVNRPEATEQENGSYRAAAMFTMSGAWRLVASVSSADRSEAFTFDLRTR